MGRMGRTSRKPLDVPIALDVPKEGITRVDDRRDNPQTLVVGPPDREWNVVLDVRQKYDWKCGAVLDGVEELVDVVGAPVDDDALAETPEIGQ